MSPSLAAICIFLGFYSFRLFLFSRNVTFGVADNGGQEAKEREGEEETEEKIEQKREEEAKKRQIRRRRRR